jgi:hypothetical protein
LAPPILLLLWATTYLRAVWILLLAPGVPIEASWTSPSGVVKFRAESFIVDPDSGMTRLKRVRIVSPNGMTLASAETLSFVGLNPLKLETSSLRVHVDQGVLNLVREANGQLEVQSLLPKGPSKPAPFPYSISIGSLAIHYVDFGSKRSKAGGPWSQDANLVQLNLAGSEHETVGASGIDVAGVGAASLTFRSGTHGEIGFQLNSAGLELSHLAEEFAPKGAAGAWRQFLPSQLAGLKVAGPLVAVIVPHEPIRAFAELKGELSKASWSQASNLPPVDSAQFKGYGTETGLSVSVALRTSGAQGSASGILAWGNGLSKGTAMAGVLGRGSSEVSVSSTASLPFQVRKWIPKGVTAQALALKGDYDFTSGSLTLADHLTASHLSSGNDVIDQVQANVLVDVNKKGNSVVVGLNQARFGKAPLHGRVEVRSGPFGERGQNPLVLRGAVEASTDEATQVLHRFTGWDPKTLGQIDGHLRVVALLGGNLDKPTGLFQGSSSGGFTLPKTRRLAVDSLFSRGSFSGLTINFDRVVAKTDGGTVLGEGLLDVGKHALGFTLDGRGLDLKQFAPEVRGLGSLAGRLEGPWNGPSFKGVAEAYDAEFQGENVAILRTDLNADPKEVLAENLQAVAGSAVIEGWLSMGFKNQDLDGAISAPDLQLADLFGENVDGAVNFKTQRIGGTLKEPEVVARAVASNLVLGNVPATFGIANFHLTGSKVAVTGGGLSVLGGSLTGQGNYDLSNQSGHFAISARNLGLDQTAAALNRGTATRLEGRIGGDLTLNVKSDLVQAEAKGQLASVLLNGSELGNGVWSLDLSAAHPAPAPSVPNKAQTFTPIDPDPELLGTLALKSSEDSDPYKDWLDHLKVKGSAQVGHESTFLSLESMQYSGETRNLTGELLASGVSIHDAIGAAMPYLTDMPDDLRARLSSADGTLLANAVLSGSLDHPDLKVSKMEAERLRLNGVALGQFKAVGEANDSSWHLQQFAYVDGPSLANLTASKEVGGALIGDAEFSQFDLDKITRAWPTIPHLAGTASASFSVGGTDTSPVLRGSLNAIGLQAAAGFDTFGLDLNTIKIQDGEASLQGDVNGLGFIGRFTASAPLRYPLKDWGATPVKGALILDSRSLASLEGLPGNFDPSRLSGTLAGQLNLEGTLAEPQASGDLAVQAQRLGFRVPFETRANEWVALKTELLDTSATVHLSQNVLSLDLQSKSSAGGGLSLSGTAKIPPLGDLLSNGNGAASVSAGQRVLDTIVQSTLKLNQFRFEENNRIITAKGTTDGALDLNGPLSGPILAGKITLDRASSGLPNLVTKEGGSGAESVDPKFNVEVRLVSPAHISTSLANFDVTGLMRLNGSLSQPDVRAGLTLTNGNLQLPGAKVALLPGGRIIGTFGVEPDGIARAHLNVDLVGESHVLSIRSFDEADPYDVTLNIRGDLLDPDRIDFATTSIPPGLDKNEILGLLGRTDILTALGANDPTGNGRDRLQNAITSYALPTLANPLTSGIASGLQLDYLNLEFNALNQTILFAGKTLKYGFSLYAQKQISSPTPGYSSLYDYRINYRPPVNRIVPRRISFFIGTDQQRPWKFGIAYSFRF